MLFIEYKSDSQRVPLIVEHKRGLQRVPLVVEHKRGLQSVPLVVYDKRIGLPIHPVDVRAVNPGIVSDIDIFFLK